MPTGSAFWTSHGPLTRRVDALNKRMDAQNGELDETLSGIRRSVGAANEAAAGAAARIAELSD